MVPARFYNLTDDEKENVCHISLSDPAFLIAMLFVWTLTCCRELKLSLFLFECLVLNTKACENMKEALVQTEGEESDSSGYVVESLPIYMKAAIIIFVII